MAIVVRGRKPGLLNDDADVDNILHLARRGQPSGWRLLVHVCAAFRSAPGTHSTKANEAGDFSASLDSVHGIDS
jgi:hypothetical protein